MCIEFVYNDINVNNGAILMSLYSKRNDYTYG